MSARLRPAAAALSGPERGDRRGLTPIGRAAADLRLPENLILLLSESARLRASWDAWRVRRRDEDAGAYFTALKRKRSPGSANRSADPNLAGSL